MKNSNSNMSIFKMMIIATVFQVCLGTAVLFLIIYVSMGWIFLIAGI